MMSVLWLIPAAAAIALILFLPLHMEIRHLPGLFSDEPVGFVEKRADLAQDRDADETYQVRTMRTEITYSRQVYAGVQRELFEIRYRGKPGPPLEIEDGRPVHFGKHDSKHAKVFFLPHEVRDISVFAHHVRTCVERYRTSS